MKYDITKKVTKGAKQTLDTFSGTMFELLSTKAFDKIFYKFFVFIALIELKIAINATPISPNTASHIEAIPNAPNTRNIALIPNANTTF